MGLHLAYNPSRPPLPTGRQALQKGGDKIPPFIKGDKGGLPIQFRYGHVTRNMVTLFQLTVQTS
jgi:hypothetical protein